MIISVDLSGNPNLATAALVRLNPNGSLDNALAGTGVKYMTNLGPDFTAPAGRQVPRGRPSHRRAPGRRHLPHPAEHRRLDRRHLRHRRPHADRRVRREHDHLVHRRAGAGRPGPGPGAGVDEGLPDAVGLFRFTAAGAVDTTFGAGDYAGTGKVLDRSTGGERTVGFAVDPAERIVIAFDAEVGRRTTRTVPSTASGCSASCPTARRTTSSGPAAPQSARFPRSRATWPLAADGRPVVVGTDYTPTDFPNFNSGAVLVARFQAGDAPAAEQTPFHGTPFQVTDAGPVTIQAEDFDRGGEGVAYHDLTPTTNTGNAYRTADGVDVKPTTDAGGGFRLSDAMAGEWLEYTIDVADAGNYDLEVRVGSPAAGGTLHLEIDGANVVRPDDRAQHRAATTRW